MKTIVITGSSSGIGKATAKLFAEQGWGVAATMRTPEKEEELSALENVRLFPLDVTESTSIENAVSQILEHFSGVDVVLNNAGYGLVGPFEAANASQIRRQFETNVFGLMEVTRAFLPHFREKNSGLFINVSSIGGLITYPFISLYHSSKWAVEGFSESLAFELRELGIQVKLIEPGAVSTDFSGRSMEFALPIQVPDYAPAAKKFLESFRNPDRVPATAREIADGIYAAATDGKDQLRYLLGNAQQLFEARQKSGDDKFIADMRLRIFG